MSIGSLKGKTQSMNFGSWLANFLELQPACSFCQTPIGLLGALLGIKWRFHDALAAMCVPTNYKDMLPLLG